jgi:hypothetical protein
MRCVPGTFDGVVILLERAVRGETGILVCPESCCTVLLVERTVRYNLIVFGAEEKTE